MNVAIIIVSSNAFPFVHEFPSFTISWQAFLVSFIKSVISPCSAKLFFHKTQLRLRHIRYFFFNLYCCHCSSESSIWQILRTRSDHLTWIKWYIWIWKFDKIWHSYSIVCIMYFESTISSCSQVTSTFLVFYQIFILVIFNLRYLRCFLVS